MTAHVYSASAGVTIKLKAEDSNDPTKFSRNRCCYHNLWSLGITHF